MVDGEVQIEDTGDTLDDLPLLLIGLLHIHHLEVVGRFDGPICNVALFVGGNGLKLITGQDGGDHHGENQDGRQLQNRQLAQYVLAPMLEAEKTPHQLASPAGPRRPSSSLFYIPWKSPGTVTASRPGLFIRRFSSRTGRVKDRVV